MPQAGVNTRLKRMEFVIGGKSYPFAVNPEEYTQDEPSMSTVTQTKGGAWVDDFGNGLPVISIRGNTGFHNGLGVSQFKELRNLIRKYMDSGSDTEFIFHNWTDDESWVVHLDPQGFRLMRSKSNPLLYMYDIRLVCLRPATHPKATTQSGGVGKTLGSAIPQAKEGNWKSAIEEYMREQLRTSPKLPPLSTVQAVKSLRIASDGRVHDVEEVTASEAVEASFSPYVSTLAVQALNRYRRSPAVTIGSIPENTLPGQLQKLESLHVPANLLTAFRMVMLEALALWEQIQADEKQLPRMVSENDINRMIENTYWLAEELFNRPDVPKDIPQNLRWLGRALQYVRNSELYRVNYAEKVGELEDALR